MSRSVAVFKQKTRSKNLGVAAMVVVTSMLNNPTFPNAGALLDAIVKEKQALDEADEAAATKALGTAGLRDAQRAKVMKAISDVVHHVQGIADTQANSVDAAAIILSAGLSIRKASKYAKPAVSAKQGWVSGSAAVDAKAVPGAVAYYWQFSLDQKSWSSVTEVTTTSTTIEGLTPGQVYYFRFRTLSRPGLSDFSQVVSLLVH